MREFYYEWNSPEREFINPELEGLRQALWSKVDAYLGVIAAETFPVRGNPARQSVPEEWEDEQPMRFNRVVKALHSFTGGYRRIASASWCGPASLIC